MDISLIGLAVVTLLFIWLHKRGEKNKRKHGLKEIPGPKGLPFIGNIHQLSKNPTKEYWQWTEQFGDIYQVKLGNRILIVVSNPKWIKEMFSVDPAFAGRVHFEGFDMYEGYPKQGIIDSDGDVWEQSRRFLLRNLRDFGFGKSAMESLITDELTETISRFKTSVGQPVGSLKTSLRLALVNSLWTILSSERFEHSDPKLINLAENTTDSFNEVLEKGMLLAFMPWLRHVIPGLSGYTRVREMIEENKRFFEETISKHKQNLDESNLKDFIDLYLAEIKKTEDTSSIFYGHVAEKQLVKTLFDLFLAGSDTTATTISWAILYLCMFPEVQEKLQKEIDEVTSCSREVCLSDKHSMPYTQALIDEILRFSSIAPEGVQHAAMADREFKGYFIPKGAMLQPNLFYVHYDKKIWGDPETFRPERFLIPDESGGAKVKYVRSENLQPFQVGRRQCVGESLARDSIFLYLTNLFQTFRMRLDGKASLQPSVGFIRSPLPYSVIMDKRLE